MSYTQWCQSCVEYHYTQGDPDQQALFGIVQGGIFPDLREQSVADITALTGVDFASNSVGLKPDESLENLWAWHQRVSARPSASA